MQRFLASIVILGLFSLPAPAGSQPSAPERVRESGSGTSFPVILTPPGTTTPQRLVGTGIRQRTIFRVNVYAFGLYVDPAGARAALAGFAERQASELRRDERFHRRLLDLDFGMALRLVMTRTVEGADIADAFDDALRPRMPCSGRRNADGAGRDAPLERLRSHLDVDEVARGTEIVFSCDPEGRLTASVGNAPRPPIASRNLCRALFDIYLGEDPIERDGKRNIIAGFARLLAPAHGAEERQR